MKNVVNIAGYKADLDQIDHDIELSRSVQKQIKWTGAKGEKQREIAESYLKMNDSLRASVVEIMDKVTESLRRNRILERKSPSKLLQVKLTNLEDVDLDDPLAVKNH